MIGARVRVASDKVDYLFGLLAGEGHLAADVDFMPVGGGEFIVTPEAWARLEPDTQREIAHWAEPGSEIVAVVPESTPAAAGARSKVPEPETGPRSRRTTKSSERGRVSNGR